MESLQGRIEKITFASPDSGYVVARMMDSATRSSITIVGHIPGLRAGETVRIEGKWKRHPRYGIQFLVARHETLQPETAAEIRRYLVSGTVWGIGPTLAEKLLDRFQEKTLEIIETQPERLAEVEGIGSTKAAQIAEMWTRHQRFREINALLQTLGAPLHAAWKIFKALGPDALEIARADPYQLSQIEGVGFGVADALAMHLGFQEDGTERIRSCLTAIMETALAEGHTWVPEDEMVEICVRRIEIPASSVRAALSELIEERTFVREEMETAPECTALFPASLHKAETAIAHRVHAMQTMPMDVPNANAAKITRQVLASLAVHLSDQQAKAMERMLKHRVFLITGGPGTGKTTLIRAITAIEKNAGRRVLLAAPTGRAARRISEVTGQKALTIHRLLEYQPKEDRFLRDRDHPLDADRIVIDEASMVDTSLMHRLISALPLQSSLVLVGDVSQLPSVGPGTVLTDLIASGKIANSELAEIYRQEERSPIVINSHRVRNGHFPDFKTGDRPAPGLDFVFLPRENTNQVLSAILSLCAGELPDIYGLDPRTDIQVLTPMHKGEVGTVHLNRQLQKRLNPRSLEAEKGQIPFGEGDKVMHLKNNYMKEIFNGDIGVVEKITSNPIGVSVNFDGRTVAYTLDDIEELSLAYAISVHKSQGSEYPAVVMPLVPQHYILLQRNLLYTAITRAQRLVVLVGSKKAVETALNNDRPSRRRTGLAYRL